MCATGVASPPPVAPSTLGTVESRAIVFEDQNTDPYDRTNLYGFNHAPSATFLGNHRVMSVWFSGPFEGSVHQVVLGAISEDDGKTWGPATVVNDTPRVSDFDPGFIDAGDRTLLFFSNGRWEKRPSLGPSKGGKKQTGVESFHMLLRTSDDQGRTWSEPREVGASPGWNCRSNGIKLSNGTLLIPTHHLKFPHTSSVLLSSDDGNTWTRGPDINTPDKVGAGEPSVAELDNGTLVMVLRTLDGNLWLTRSFDHGHTWAEPERQGLPAATSSANLYYTSDGKLVLTHNPTPPGLRTKLTLRVSKDAGRTWSDPMVLAEVEPTTEDEATWSRQVCYPSVCELPDGVLLVLWADIEISADSQSGVIQSARVHLK